MNATNHSSTLVTEKSRTLATDIRSCLNRQHILPIDIEADAVVMLGLHVLGCSSIEVGSVQDAVDLLRNRVLASEVLNKWRYSEVSAPTAVQEERASALRSIAQRWATLHREGLISGFQR